MRRLSGASVVAITGSAGKTSTKEATAEFLATRHTVYRNVGNLNNHIGLPLSLLELRSRPDVAVVELGMNHAGEISRLVELAEPDVRVWTNVGDAHVGHFASVDAIADAKAEVLERATERDACGGQRRRRAGHGAREGVCRTRDDVRAWTRTPRFARRTCATAACEARRHAWSRRPGRPRCRCRSPDAGR